MTDMTFGDRIRAVAADVAYLEKKGFNKHFKYAFVREGDVKAAVNAALRAHGLFVRHVTYTAIGPCDGKSATLLCHVTISDGDDCVTYQGVGSGSDSSDKGSQKACAAALKYALTSGFLIETGDDPEEDGGTADKKSSPISPKPAAPATTEPAPAKSDPSSYEMLLAALEGVTDPSRLAALKTAAMGFAKEPRFAAPGGMKEVFIAAQKRVANSKG